MTAAPSLEQRHRRLPSGPAAGLVAAGVAAIMALAAVALGAASVTGPPALRWAAGAMLLVLVAAAGALCAHAGGHAVFVVFPAAIIAVVWAVVVAGPHPAAGWWLVALSAATVSAGGAMAATVARQRRRPGPLATASLVGATGTSLTPLAPDGIVQIAGESWTARSLSGPLGAGAPVHVVRLEGVRLAVWSEAGAVPDAAELDRWGVEE